ncbi:MAG: 16S rRNA (guanine(527)-N(7))-methyltransferase RsmG [Dehalococcoidia bacterium]
MDRLIAGAAAWGIDLTPGQVAQFEILRHELLAWNQRMNLTAITDPDEVETRHFLDSLTVSLAFPEGLGPGARLLDVGSGAGFPGIPLKIVHQWVSLVLLEATRKKAAFLEHVVNRLNLSDVRVVAERAEDAARQPQHREAYQVVAARALAPLPTVVELTLPFCALGGVVVAQAQGDIGAALERVSKTVARLGGRVRECRPVAVPGLDGGRALVISEKVVPSPEAYPRRAGVPAKRPLA